MYVYIYIYIYIYTHTPTDRIINWPDGRFRYRDPGLGIDSRLNLVYYVYEG